MISKARFNSYTGQSAWGRVLRFMGIAASQCGLDRYTDPVNNAGSPVAHSFVKPL